MEILCLSNILILFFVILVLNFNVMNSLHLERSPDFKYPAIELDMTNSLEHLSDEYICRKVQDAEDDTVQISPKIIDCKTDIK